MLATFSPSMQTPVLLALGMRLKRPLIRLAVLLAIAVALLPMSQARAGETHTAVSPESAVDQPMLAQTVSSQTPAFPQAGRYLFGQVAQRDQLGQGYIVLESTGEQVFGALYYPSSSFDCFQGNVQGGRLAMTITNSYTQETYPYSIALVADSSVATAAPGSLEPLSLQGFHQISNITDNDLRLLETCRATVGIEI